MSVCGDLACESRENLWIINDKDPLPICYPPFTLCHTHLKEDARFAEVYAALLKGRLQGQEGPTLLYKNWHFTKVLSSWQWKKGVFCSICHQPGKIWKRTKWISNDLVNYPYGGVESKYFCNKDLPKENLENIFIEEETWLE